MSRRNFRAGDIVLIPQITREGVRLPRWTPGKVRSVERGRAAVLTSRGLVVSDTDVLELAGNSMAAEIELSLQAVVDADLVI